MNLIDGAKFYYQTKYANKIEENEKLEKQAELDSKIAADLKGMAINFAKRHPKAAENAITGGIMGAGSELVMPSNRDPMTGRSYTSLGEIAKRGVVGAAFGGVGGEVKSRVSDRLAKMAEVPVPQEEPKDSWGQKAVRVVGAGIGKDVANGLMGSAVVPTIHGKRRSSEDIMNTAESLKKNMGVQNKVNVENVGDHFHPLTKEVTINPRSKDHVIAHELGHAKLHGSNKYLGGALMAGRFAGNLSNPLSTMYAAGQEDPSYTPGAVNLAMNAPTLLDEAGASILGTKGLMKQHGTGKGLMKGLSLLPAFGTYAAQAAAPLAVTGVRKYMRNRNQQDMSQEQPMQQKIAGVRDVASKVWQNPTARGALIGGGVGTGLGAMGSMYEDARGGENPLGTAGNAIAGGLAYAGIGGALGHSLKNPRIRQAMEMLYSQKPNTSGHTIGQKIKNFASDPITKNTLGGAAIGGGLQTASEFYTPHEDAKGKELPINKFNVGVSALLGGLVGHNRGLAQKLKQQPQKARDFAEFAKKTKDTVRPYQNRLAAGPTPFKEGPPIHSYSSEGINYDVLPKGASPKGKPVSDHVVSGAPWSGPMPKTASVGEFLSKYKGPLIGGGLGLGLGALNTHSYQKEYPKENLSFKDKFRMTTAPAIGGAALGALATMGGSKPAKQWKQDFNKHHQDIRNMADNLQRVRDIAYEMKTAQTKTAFVGNAFRKGMETAGSLYAKNPTAGGMALGAATGAVGNFLSGSEHGIASTAGGAALGALGGKRLVPALSHSGDPLLGHSFAKGMTKKTFNPGAAPHSVPMSQTSRVSTTPVQKTVPQSQGFSGGYDVHTGATPRPGPELSEMRAQEIAKANSQKAVANSYTPRRSSMPIPTNVASAAKPAYSMDPSMLQELRKVAGLD